MPGSLGDFFFLYWVFCLHVCVPHAYSAHRGQMRASGALELESRSQGLFKVVSPCGC